MPQHRYFFIHIVAFQYLFSILRLPCHFFLKFNQNIVVTLHLLSQTLLILILFTEFFYLQGFFFELICLIYLYFDGLL